MQLSSGLLEKRIIEELGPINYYVNDKLKQPICVTDDDITGTFTFLRALRDFDIFSLILEYWSS